jgi:hypothetical protein
MDDTKGRTEELLLDQTVSRKGPGVVRRLALVVALAVWGGVTVGCGGEKPPEIIVPPVDEMCPGTQVRFCTDPPAAAAAREAASDATSRSVRALENAEARAALATKLGQLESALAAGNITKARLALSDSRTALGAAGSQAADMPDVGAIELMLDHVDPLIGR